jgi:hypothetical protein
MFRYRIPKHSGIRRTFIEWGGQGSGLQTFWQKKEGRIKVPFCINGEKTFNCPFWGAASIATPPERSR